MTPSTVESPSEIRDTVLALLDAESRPWTSIYVPVEWDWGETKSNAIRLRSLLDQIRERASEDLPSLDVEAMLAPADERRDDPVFWEEASEGVALLLAPDEHVIVDLPFAPSIFAEIDDRVHVRPLWRHLEPDGHAYVLGLSAGGVALYRTSRYDVTRVPLEGPTTLEEVLEFDDHIQSLRYHTKTAPGGAGGRRPAIFYGQEDAGDKTYVKEGILRFFRTLDNQVRDVLGQDPTPVPLLLAGVEALRGAYRQVSQYPHLLDDSIEGSVIDANTREWDADQLQKRAWEVVRPRFDQDRKEALDRFRSAPEQTAANPGSVLLAAEEGRVDTLFVAEDPTVWGVYNADSHTVRVHDKREAGDIELLNAATVATLQSGGTVYVTGDAEVPEGSPIAALLRY